MKRLIFAMWLATSVACAQTNSPDKPTWWAKYQTLLQNGAGANTSTGTSFTVGSNVDVSNECGPQSETFITLNPSSPQNLAAGSNEIFRNPMRGYFSFDGGNSWSGVDLPLPPPIGTNGTTFGSDPSLAFDTKGNTYYGYIVVYTGAGMGINGTSMAVAKSTDGGKTYPSATYFSFQNGSNHFNDKPIIAADTTPSSPFHDYVYAAWDAASGGSTGGGIRVAASADGGSTFSISRVDNPSGPGKSIAADPFVGPDGELYVAWNDYSANVIAFNRSFDGGATWDKPRTIASKQIAFDIAIPAESFRGALVYPTCGVDRSNGSYHGRLYCSWMDFTASGTTTNIYASYSDDQGVSWSEPVSITDKLSLAVDRFYPWLSVDPVTGDVNVSFYDTRNDTTGSRYMTDVYLTQSTNGGTSWSPNTRVSTASSNEHDCNGLFPCPAINYGNQYGDYEGLVSFGGVSHPVWTDSRDQLNPAFGCRTNLAMEEVFTAAVQKQKSGK
jgi:hypothetical protein